VSIRLVCLDMAGTTVSDDGAVERAFTSAVIAMGMGVDTVDYEAALTVVRNTMGRSKIEVFRLLFGDESTAVAANLAFEDAYAALVDQGEITALPGAEETIVRLRDSGIRICLTTGFAPVTRDRIIDKMGWHGLIDLALAPADVERGRPYPDMIWAAATRLGIDELAEVAVVGDTPSDMASGTAAGAAMVVGVLTGASTADQLRDAGATDVIPSVDRVLDLIGLGVR
jgi:phosphoglycolate phosphatase